jgi:hypothetical protein
MYTINREVYAELQRLETQYHCVKVSSPESLLGFMRKKFWQEKTDEESAFADDIHKLGKRILARRFEEQSVSDLYPFRLWPREFEFQSKIAQGGMEAELLSMSVVRSTYHNNWVIMTAQVRAVERVLREYGCYYGFISRKWSCDYLPILSKVTCDTTAFRLAAEGSPVHIPTATFMPPIKVERVVSQVVTVVNDVDMVILGSVNTVQSTINTGLNLGQQEGEILAQKSEAKEVLSCVFPQDIDDKKQIRVTVQQPNDYKDVIIEFLTAFPCSSIQQILAHLSSKGFFFSPKLFHRRLNAMARSGRLRKSTTNGKLHYSLCPPDQIHLSSEIVRNLVEWVDPHTGVSFLVKSQYVGRSSRGEFIYGPGPTLGSLPFHHEIPVVGGQSTWSLGSGIRFDDERTSSDTARLIAVGLYDHSGVLIEHCGSDIGPFGHSTRRPITIFYSAKGIFFRLVCTGMDHVPGGYVRLCAAFKVVDGLSYFITPPLLVQVEGAGEKYSDPNAVLVGMKSKVPPHRVNEFEMDDEDREYGPFVNYINSMVEIGVLHLSFRRGRWTFSVAQVVRMDDAITNPPEAMRISETSTSFLDGVMCTYSNEDFGTVRKGVWVKVLVQDPYVRSFATEVEFQVALRKLMTLCKQIVFIGVRAYALTIVEFTRKMHKGYIDYDKRVKFTITGESVKIGPRI